MDFIKNAANQLNSGNNANANANTTTGTTTGQPGTAGQPAAGGQQQDYGDKGTLSLPPLTFPPSYSPALLSCQIRQSEENREGNGGSWLKRGIDADVYDVLL